jgi:aerobic C4-dicarboxylate transport protein
VQVFVAMLIGAALGRFSPGAGIATQPFGDAFIRAIRMLIAPLIFCTVVHGIAHISDSMRVGRLAIKALVYFEILTTIALALALLLVNVLRPGAGMNIDLTHVDTVAAAPYLKQVSDTGVVPFLLNIIPNTFVGAFVEGNILQVLFIAVLSGFALISLGAVGKPFLQLVDSASHLIFATVNLVMWAAPLGAFGAMAFTVGKFGMGSLLSLGKLVGEFYGICLIFIVVVLGTVAALCRFNLFKLIRYLRDEILICIATTSSEIVMPRLMSL